MNKETLQETIRNYCWIISEIERLEQELQEYEFSGTAQYGEEAAMPKAVGHISNPVAGEAIRRQAKSKRRIRMEEKVMYIQNRLHVITDDRKRALLDCLLDGLTLTETAKHLCISRQKAWQLQTEIVDELIGG